MLSAACFSGTDNFLVYRCWSFKRGLHLSCDIPSVTTGQCWRAVVAEIQQTPAVAVLHVRTWHGEVSPLARFFFARFVSPSIHFAVGSGNSNVSGCSDRSTVHTVHAFAWVSLR